MTTVYDAILAGVAIVGGVVLISWCYSKRGKKDDDSEYGQGREFATKFCQEKGISESSIEELQNFVDGAKTFGDYSPFDAGIEDIIRGINVTKIAPRNITPRNVLGILEIFGLTGHMVHKSQGWSRCYIQHCAQPTRLVPKPIPLQFGRIMFENGKFSHFNFYLDPQGRIHDTMYYEVALLLFRATGIELDAPAWDDLAARAKLREDARCEQRARERGQLPAKAKGARRKRSAPNYAHAVMQTLESDISELRQKDLLESLSCDDKPEQV